MLHKSSYATLCESRAGSAAWTAVEENEQPIARPLSRYSVEWLDGNQFIVTPITVIDLAERSSWCAPVVRGGQVTNRLGANVRTKGHRRFVSSDGQPAR
jgi:hypothetical protein